MPITPTLGSVMMFGGNFAPKGWAFCNGQLLSISQNTALFSLLGTTYGGNGTTTFALPDLRGRVPVHLGGAYSQGLVAGAETVALVTSQLPVHTHGVTGGSPASSQPATATDPAGRVFAVPTDGGTSYANSATGALASTGALPSSGSSAAHSNMQPYLCISFCIALQGIFPTRN